MITRQLGELIDLLLEINSKKEMEDFLLGIFTPKERQEIPMRLSIVKMLKKGVRQHSVAERLGVGIATVTRGSRELRKGRFKAVN
ncbi:MAG: Trp family transcriptional regulator [Candidatus Daviesbacteria bacterium]|nr:Trp family transcriptional regulator [Candidatus Daviesbacteria bacterium]